VTVCARTGVISSERAVKQEIIGKRRYWNSKHIEEYIEMKSRNQNHRNLFAMVFLGAIFVLLQTGVASAQTSQTPQTWGQDKGFRLGFALNSVGVDAEKSPGDGAADDIYLEEEGGGIELSCGYSFSQLFSLNFAISGARHETNDADLDAYYTTALLEGHFRFMPDSRVRPYLVAAIGGAALNLDNDDYTTKTEGGVFGLGLGMLWNLTDHLLLDTSLRLDMIDWEDREFKKELPGGQELVLAEPVDDESGAGRFQLGLTYAF
jgi:Outer membrane protein beta-barrel domain